MVSADFRRQLEGFGLTTANILYRMPDHPDILQNYIWQQHDLHPHFPELRKFLDFWARELDGLLHSVTVARAPDQAVRNQGSRGRVPVELRGPAAKRRGRGSGESLRAVDVRAGRPLALSSLTA